MKKFIALFFALSALSSAFAGDVYPTVDGYAVYLPSCGGTVRINNGGANQQLNVVFSKVQDCSNVILQDGRSYQMNQPQGQRNGSYTLLTASQYPRGSYYTIITVRSNSGAHSDRAIVYFNIN